MDTKTAVTLLIQGEKIKSGIIWATQIVDRTAGLSPNDKQGAEKVIRDLIGMIGYESVLARRTTGDETWVDVEKNLDMALVMVNSGVCHEAAYHLGIALRSATSVSSRAMRFLMEQGIL
jgi:hypothetical protein